MYQIFIWYSLDSISPGNKIRINNIYFCTWCFGNVPIELFREHAEGLLQRISNYRVSHCDMVPSHFSCNAVSWPTVHINSNSRYGRSKSYDSIWITLSSLLHMGSGSVRSPSGCYSNRVVTKSQILAAHFSQFTPRLLGTTKSHSWFRDGLFLPTLQNPSEIKEYDEFRQ
jgi:hypothetical protein